MQSEKEQNLRKGRFGDIEGEERGEKRKVMAMKKKKKKKKKEKWTEIFGEKLKQRSAMADEAGLVWINKYT